MFMSQSQHPDTSAGFTILELMVATSVFTVVLLVVAVGALSFTNSYYKGINSSKTQATARAIMNEVVQDIQFGKTVTQVSSAGSASGLCIDNTLYSYVIGQEVVDSAPQSNLHQDYQGLVMAAGSDCSGATPSVPSSQTLTCTASGCPRELLGSHMRLSDFRVTPSGNNLYTVHVRVLYGEDDLFIPAINSGTVWSQENCKGGTGSQFCAVSDLTTTVQQRLL